MSLEHDPFYEKGNTDDMAQARLAELGLTDLQEPGSVTSEKARMLYITQKFFSADESYNLCSFVWGVGWQLYGPGETVEMLRAATGWDITLDEFLEVGERRMNMMRAFNAREGFDRKNDVLAKKFFRPLQGTGPCAGVKFTREEFEKWKDDYYGWAGWDVASGNPTSEKLASLGLDWIKI
jgi:aldehyde:ferredoxin oxidoreductase